MVTMLLAVWNDFLVVILAVRFFLWQPLPLPVPSLDLLLPSCHLLVQLAITCPTSQQLKHSLAPEVMSALELFLSRFPGLLQLILLVIIILGLIIAKATISLLIMLLQNASQHYFVVFCPED